MQYGQIEYKYFAYDEYNPEDFRIDLNLNMLGFLLEEKRNTFLKTSKIKIIFIR